MKATVFVSVYECVFYLARKASFDQKFFLLQVNAIITRTSHNFSRDGVVAFIRRMHASGILTLNKSTKMQLP